MAGSSGIPSYSTTPLTNSTFDGGNGNWAENQLPSTVNNTARQQTADIRSAFNDLIWFSYGSGDQASGSTYLSTPYVYASATSVTVAGVDVTTAHHAGRRMKFVGATTGTIYGAISSSSFSTNTTINITFDSGSLSNETLTGYLSQVPVTGSPLPGGGGGVLAAIATSGSASDLITGTVPNARFPATLPAVSGVNLTNLNASNLTSGTVPDARFPATLPAASGVNLTALNASNLASGTVPDARFPATLPAASGVNLTALNGSNIASGTVAAARLPADVAYLDVAQSYTKSQRGTPATLTESGNAVTPDFDAAQNFTLTLVHGSACTFNNPSSTPVAGQSGVIEVIQSSTGSDTITWGTQYVSAGGTSTLTLSTGANAKDYISYYVADSTHIVIALGAANVSH
jgi:hypothetical protein